MKKKAFLLCLETTINDAIPVQKISRKVESIKRAMLLIEETKKRLTDDEILKAQIFRLELVVSKRYSKKEKVSWEEL